MGERELHCLDSWHRYCPEYKLKLWNENNVDISKNRYTQQAYASKKYAFVTDYVRLYALYNEGGIYMDTDVEVLRPLDDFIQKEAFSGFETESKIPTGIMGSPPGNEWIRYLLSYYEDAELSFIRADGEFNLKTNVETITEMTKLKYKVCLNNTRVHIENVLDIYPKDYFCPKDPVTGNIEISSNTYTIHHFNGSWHGKLEEKSRWRRQKICKALGRKTGTILNALIYNYEKDGIKGVLCKAKKFRKKDDK